MEQTVIACGIPGIQEPFGHKYYNKEMVEEPFGVFDYIEFSHS